MTGETCSFAPRIKVKQVGCGGPSNLMRCNIEQMVSAVTLVSQTTQAFYVPEFKTLAGSHLEVSGACPYHCEVQQVAAVTEGATTRDRFLIHMSSGTLSL